ncbi:hypothetical protein TNCV_4361591 [Trichonephila clavipes]|nr:hypothetical protein TNCV_4361591 [Trichonephila clavipes]
MVGFVSEDTGKRVCRTTELDADQFGGYAPPNWSCTGLNSFPAGSLFGSFTVRKHVVHGCSTIDPITPPAARPDQLQQRVEVAWSAVPQEPTQSPFESMLRFVAVVISNNGGCSGC